MKEVTILHAGKGDLETSKKIKTRVIKKEKAEGI